jgi:hypothetical protein
MITSSGKVKEVTYEKIDIYDYDTFFIDRLFNNKYPEYTMSVQTEYQEIVRFVPNGKAKLIELIEESMGDYLKLV